MSDRAEKKPKHTALVTGASAGLGKEIATLAAKDGHDVVVVARSEAKLVELAGELEKAHGVKVHVISADLGARGAAKRVHEAVEELGVQVDFLVNNAGFGSNGAFLDLDLKREVEMIDVNITALVELTHYFGKRMVERKLGRVMNIASTAGFQPGPFMATYYATKAFVVMWSEALAYELDGSGVTVTCYCPGATKTEFASTAGNEKSKLFQRSGVAEAKDVALDAYKAMMSGDVLSVHGALNWIAFESLRFAPRSVARSIAASLNKPA
jgi:short-subunit dehydrogenase